MAREPQLMLNWERTWPDDPTKPDFTARLEGLSYLRVYRSPGAPDPASAWVWFARHDLKLIGSGRAAGKIPACKAAETAWSNRGEKEK